MEGCDFRVPPGRERRRAVRHRAHPAGPGAEYDRNLQRPRGDEGLGIKRIAFSSTGSTYGEAKVIPTPEDAPFPVQTSLYGASKVAGEGLISAYCEGFGFEGYIFRFVSILGERYTHGHVFDFYKQLVEHPGSAADPRRRLAEKELPLRPGLHRRHPPRRSEIDGQGAKHRTRSTTSGRGVRAGERQRPPHLQGPGP
jgi:hypothetical protein